jgi:hypothetical protein
VAGKHRVRIHVVPWREHERALVRPWMRQRQLGVCTHLAVHGNDVDIQGARPPAHLAHAVERGLDLVEPVKQAF